MNENRATLLHSNDEIKKVSVLLFCFCLLFCVCLFVCLFLIINAQI